MEGREAEEVRGSAAETALAAPAEPAPGFASPATLEALELPSLLAVVAQLAASDLGRARVLALAPLASEAELAPARHPHEEAAPLLARPPPGAGLPRAVRR